MGSEDQRCGHDKEAKRGFYPRHRNTNAPASPNFPLIEKDILKYWRQDNTFQASVEARAAGNNGSNEFVFYDGPPFANGLPHYGHLLTGYVKDMVGRYQTMRGRRVERRFGWDTHGLPAELEAERILGIDDKSQIEGECGIGIEKFNEACRSSVLRYTGEWEEYVTRQARWVDFSNDYKTLDINYMESVIWAFKELYDRGLAYEGYRVLPYCWNDETPLSNHELKMDDEVYQDRQDNTVTVGLRLETGELALIWTTTPWTLPSNSAIAVGPEVDYACVQPLSGMLKGQKVILAKALLGFYTKELGEDAKLIASYKGKELVGRRYTPIFDYYVDSKSDRGPGPKAWTIVAADYVTTEDGTGLVHIAPAFGEEDMNVCVQAGIGTVIPVDEAGKFTSEVYDYEGIQVFDANKTIVRDLRRGFEDNEGPLARVAPENRAILVQQRPYNHPYPHCWRCRQPLIYRAVSSWFVRVTAIRDRMVELNQSINWVPNHIKDGQFGKWLEGARDWSISRNRFWGAPIPVWVSDDPQYPRVEVYGSIKDLEEAFGVPVKDLHRPFIDTLVRANPDDPTGKSMMRRIPDVLDCWFESGSMPFAQVHYPFENRDWFENHYPGDFIVEYIGQTRGWFYTLHVLATALFDRPAFTNCVSHGIVLGDDGRKMSKSLRNYPDVNEVFDLYGSDAMRFFLMSSPVVRGGNLVVTAEAIRDTVRQVILPLWNVYYFFALYSGTCRQGDGYEAKLLDLEKPQVIAGLDVMDRFLLAATKRLSDQMRLSLDNYAIAEACELLRSHLDLLTNWYVRNSRERFWKEEDKAFDTLYTALEVTMRAVAPFLPLLSEEIWRGLTAQRSVHLQDYPQLPDCVQDDALVNAMNQVREAVSATHALRKAEKLRVRLPLAKLSIVCPDPVALSSFSSLIKSEVNVKQVEFLTPENSGLKVGLELTLLPREFSPQVRKLTSALFAAQKSGDFEVISDSVIRFPSVLSEGKPVELQSPAFQLAQNVSGVPGTATCVLASGNFVVLDTTLTPELEAEGEARDLVRSVQEQRKIQGFDVSDRIRLKLELASESVEKVRKHQEMIAQETLALQISLMASNDGQTRITIEKAD